MVMQPKEIDIFGDYLIQNRDEFINVLLLEAKNVRPEIDKIMDVGNIDLLSNAQKIVKFIMDKKTDDLIKFAEQEGVAWATYRLTLAFKLEWIQAIRRTMWIFLHKLNQNKDSGNLHAFFNLEKDINEQVDQFLNNFFLSYSNCKDKLIDEQTELVNNLSVPIIPVTGTIAVLPLIGSLTLYRIGIIEEKVLEEISRMKLQTLLIDLSGIAEMEEGAIARLMRVIDGTAMMGCKSVVTGIRPEVVRTMMNLNLSFVNKVSTKGTLQQALRDYL
ncbi:MAG: STAS domain-containing protein [Bacillus sp. (in: firmicutes)]